MIPETHETARLDLAAEAVAGWLRTEFPGYLVRRRWRFLGERWLFELEPLGKGDPAHELHLDLGVLRSLGDGLVAELTRCGVGQHLRDNPNTAYQFEAPGGLCRLWPVKEDLHSVSLPPMGDLPAMLSDAISAYGRASFDDGASPPGSLADRTSDRTRQDKAALVAAIFRWSERQALPIPDTVPLGDDEIARPAPGARRSGPHAGLGGPPSSL